MASTSPGRVLVVFKTHLDVGFTELAAQVRRDYLEGHLPGALATARALRREQGEARLRWTLGSWMVTEALEQPDRTAAREVAEGIEAGDLWWHALPFTMHTGLLDASLAADSLGLAARLDARFGRRTRAAKMTDVPGHTIGLVPVLATAGVTFLHIGVNPAWRAPQVPALFRWHEPTSGASVHVAYQRGGYGGDVRLDDDTVLVVSHTGDNLGPPTAADVRAVFDTLAARYPHAAIEAASLDAAAEVLERRTPLALAADRSVDGERSLPVVTDEIGDPWIHGAGSDPVKVAQFRALCRVRARAVAAGTLDVAEGSGERATRALCLVAEHTWGLDEKVHLPDTTTYSPDAVALARRHDPNWRRFEASWAEQRGYVAQAAQALSDAGSGDEVSEALDGIEPSLEATRAEIDRLDLVEPGAAVVAGGHVLGVDPRTGALDRWVLPDGRCVADANHPLALLGYQTFSHDDYERHWERCLDVAPEDAWWARQDNMKLGIADAEPRAVGRFWAFTVVEVRAGSGSGDLAGTRVAAVLAGDERAVSDYGCPAIVVVLFDVVEGVGKLTVEVRWFAKQATRYPEALWCTWSPAVSGLGRWHFDQLGIAVDPATTVAGGGRHLHAVGRGIAYASADDTAPSEVVAIECVDTPLVAPGRPALLDRDDGPLDLSGGMHTCLFDNVWGTNFPMWCDDDLRARFVVHSTDPAWW